VETAIEPEMQICDAHHHLRRPEGQSYLSADFLRDAAGGHNIIKTVFVQSITNRLNIPGGGMTPVEETQFALQDIANIKTKIKVAAAIIGAADLTTGDAVAPILEAHIAAGNSRFRGIRFMPRWNPDSTQRQSMKDVLSDKKFQDGFTNLRKYKLVCDMMIGYYHLAELADFAKVFSDVPIIINHLGFPVLKGNEKEREAIIKEWKAGISTLVPCKNVSLKLGGIGGDMLGFGWQKRTVPPGSVEITGAIAPYFLYCIEQFGANRCMFESNFPVDKESYSYTVIWNAFKRLTKDFSPAERRALFLGTAEKVYRI
jgi:L-fuconolactonase